MSEGAHGNSRRSYSFSRLCLMLQPGFVFDGGSAAG